MYRCCVYEIDLPVATGCIYIYIYIHLILLPIITRHPRACDTMLFKENDRKKKCNIQSRNLPTYVFVLLMLFVKKTLVALCHSFKNQFRASSQQDNWRAYLLLAPPCFLAFLLHLCSLAVPLRLQNSQHH